LASPPAYIVFPPPPPPPDELFVLPVPVFVPVPVWINPPPYVATPPGNVIFNNIHNTTIINNDANVINPSAPGAAGVGAGVAAGVAAGAAAGAIAARVALPPSVARKASEARQLRGSNPASQCKERQQARPGAVPSTRLPTGHELPGVAGKPSRHS